MSTTDRETIMKLQAELAERQAKDAAIQAELEELRKRAHARRHETEPGRLTQNQIDKAIKQARKDGKRRKLPDGGNLVLQIYPATDWGKGQHGWHLKVSWMFIWGYTDSTVPKGKKGRYKGDSVGLGSLDNVPLAEAREKARQCRKWLGDGDNPRVELQRLKYEASKADTFRTVNQLLDEYLDKKVKPEAKEEETWKQVAQRFRDFVRPHIGAMPVESVTLKTIEDQVLRRNVQNPTKDTDDIWTRKHTTASETRRHMEHAFTYGIGRGYRTTDNPARWEDNGLSETLPRPGKVHTVVHRASLDFRQLPTFVQRLRAFRYDVAWPLTGTGRPVVSYALELVVLSGARVSEVLEAEFDEFYLDDPEDMKWTIPGKHTKSGKPRSLPIPTTMLAILREMRKLRGHSDRKEHALVFPGILLNGPTGKPIATNTLMRLTHNLGYDEIENHGFRSTFKDWCTGRAKKHCPGYQFEWYRMQCDHWEGVPKSEQAYGPDRHLDERRPLMQAYDDYATTPPTKADVAPLKKRRTA